MSADIQYLVVALIIAAALIITVKRSRDIIKRSGTDPKCAGCPLAEQCSKAGSKNRNEKENCKKCRDNVAQSGN